MHRDTVQIKWILFWWYILLSYAIQSSFISLNCFPYFIELMPLISLIHWSELNQLTQKNDAIADSWVENSTVSLKIPFMFNGKKMNFMESLFRFHFLYYYRTVSEAIELITTVALLGMTLIQLNLSPSINVQLTNYVKRFKALIKNCKFNVNEFDAVALTFNLLSPKNIKIVAVSFNMKSFQYI